VRRGLPFTELEALRESLGLSLQELVAYADAVEIGEPRRLVLDRRLLKAAPT
jgi:hypothetical protein